MTPADLEYSNSIAHGEEENIETKPKVLRANKSDWVATHPKYITNNHI